MKIYSPNKQYTGISASVTFVNGVGETDSPHLINWFKEHGYTVGETTYIKEINTNIMLFSNMKKEELIELCDEKGIPYNSKSTKEELIEKLNESDCGSGE